MPTTKCRVPSRKTRQSARAKLPDILEFIDSVLFLDHNEKWLQTFDQVFVKEKK